MKPSDSSKTFECDFGPEGLEPSRARFVATPWGPFALYQDEAGEVHCLDAFCPHMEGPLFEGTVMNGEVVCPWHQWRYELKSGCRVDAPGKTDGENADCVLRRCELERTAQGHFLLHAPDRPPRELPGLMPKN